MKTLKKRIICFISVAMMLISTLTPSATVFSEEPDNVIGTVEYSDENRRIAVSYTADSGIPSNCQLYVNQSYDKLENASQILGLNSEDYIYYSEFIDMELEYSGEKIIPTAPVTVSIEIPNAANDADFRTVLFGETSIEEIECTTTDKTVVFSTSEISSFGIIGAVSPTITESMDEAELSVFTLDSDTAVIADSDSVSVPEEGYETLIAVDFTDNGDDAQNWVKTGLSDGARLGENESIGLYAVEDGTVGDAIISDISESDDVESVDSGIDSVALVKDTGFRHLSLELHPEGTEGTVVLDGMMPKEASAEAYDVTGEQSDPEGEITLAAYDISIINGDIEYQPYDKPVRVEITDSRITAGDIVLYHISDSGEREEVTGFEVTDGSISFDAYGFSVYQIVSLGVPEDEGYDNVDVSSEETAVDFTAHTVDSSDAFVYKVVSQNTSTATGEKISSKAAFDAAIAAGKNGFYISSVNTQGRFAMNADSENLGGNASRTGIAGTLSSLEIKDKYLVAAGNAAVDPISLTVKASLNGAAKYYFEDAGDGTYYIYCLSDDGERMYVSNSDVTGTYVSLALLSEQDNAMRYTVADYNSTIEIICAEDACNTYRWQYTKTNVNGFGAGNVANNDTRLYLWYAEEPASDPLGLNGNTYGLVNATAATAVMASNRSLGGNNINQLGAAPVTAATDAEGNSCFTSAYGISGWTFEWIEGTYFYKVRAIADDGAEPKYLKITSSAVSLVDSDEASLIYAAESSTGTVSLIAADGMLGRNGTDKYYRVAINNINGNDYRLYLVDVSNAATDIYGIDGASYGLVNIFDTNQGNAIMSEYKSGSETVLANQAVWRTDTGFSFGGGITEWKFKHIDFNRYTICATCKDGSTKYIRLDSTGVLLSDTPYILTLIPGTGDYEGTVKIVNTAHRIQIKNNKNNSQYDVYTNNITDGSKDKWFTFIKVPKDSANDPLGLDGKTYGIVNPTYKNGIINDGYAMMGTSSGISSKQLTYDSTEEMFKIPESLISAWTFHYVDHSNYILSTKTADGEKYLRFGYGSGTSLVDESEATPVYIEAGSDEREGMIRIMPLLDGTLSVLYRDGGKFVRGTNYNNLSNNNVWHYLVDNVDLFDPYSLDGQTYGLIYTPDTASGNALMAEDDGTTYDKLYQVVTHTDNNSTIARVYVSGDSDITEWTFTCTGRNVYLLQADNGKYLKASGDTLILCDSEDDASPFTALLSSTGLTFSSEGKYIGYDGGFVMSDDAVYLEPAEKTVLTDDDHITYTAERISVSDGEQAYDKRELIVYTRIWNSKEKIYEFYAIDHDGTMKKCYVNGDELMWLDNEMNTLLWTFKVYHDKDGKETGYYELQNNYSGMFLYPQIDGSFLSSTAKQIELPGRLYEENGDGTKNYGEYYSDIIAWDDDYYSYAALKGEPQLDKNNNITSVDLTTTYMYGSDKSFYFAVPELVTSDEEVLHTVDTIDNDLYGITMKLIDFGPTKAGNIGAGNSSVTQNYFGGNYSDRKGLLSKNLNENGLPTVLYSGNSEQIGMEFDAFEDSYDVNHLFIQSVYDASGYFEFDSTQNTATLVGEDGRFGTDFTVYRELATHDASDGNTRKHGQFFPFNTIAPGIYSEKNPQNLYTALLSKPLPDDDPRKYEKLYHFLAQDSGEEWTVKDYNKIDYYFGMELEASFVQTPRGLDSWGHDIIFEFTGDDDFWLYVDGVLAIDLGGVHSAYGAKVNFKDGTITYTAGDNNSLPHTLKQAFTNAYIEKNSDATQDEINAYLDQYFDGDVFREYTMHTMKVFYMERGAGASNLHMRFNLSSVTKGKVLFAKSLTDMDGNNLETSDIDLDKLKFPFQIWYAYDEYDEETGYTEPGEWQPIGKYHIDGEGNTSPSVSYQNSTQTVEFANEYISPNRTDYTYNNVFFLIPGRPLEIRFPDDAIWYKITECAVDTSIYSIALGDGSTIDGKTVSGSIKDLSTAGVQVKLQPTQNFINKINTDYIRNLDITKHLYRDRTKKNELTYEDDQTTFSFRLYISDGTSEELEPANLQSYYILDPDGYLCVRDVATKKFTSYIDSSGNKVLPENVTSLTAAEKAKVTFHTSSYGAISQIPVGYTVRVPGVVAGTRFFVDEKDSEIPVGYDLIDYEDGKVGSADSTPIPSYTYTNSYKLNGETITLPDNKKYAAGIVQPSYDPLVNINNVKGWGIEAEKVWSDSDFVDEHDTIYLAVYVKNGIGDDTDYELVPDSVRALTSDNTDMRWFFDTLESGKNISDYKVFEVTLTNPVIDVDGIVHYVGSPVIVEDGTTVKLNVTDMGSETPVKDDYIVEYSEPSVSDQGNALDEKIYNKRKRGIMLRLNEWNTEDGEDTPLPSGTFEIRCNDNVIDTYTSDENGVITTLYGFKEGDIYTITETKSPTGYVAMKEPITFKIAKNDTTYSLSDWTNSNDNNDDDTNTSDGKNWAEYSTSDPVYNAIIDIYNPEFVLKAIKVDGNDETMALSGVHFELHRQVVSSISGVSMDAKPMTGYENLVSDDDGIIEKIDSTLPPGVYYLVETQALDGYKMMELQDAIQFEITDNGDVEMVREDQKGLLKVVEGTYQMTISVPNVHNIVTLTISKTVNGNMGNKDKEFNFTIKAGSPDSYTSYTEVESDAGEIEEGEMMSFTLSHGDSFSLDVPAAVDLTVTEENTGYSTTMQVGDEEAVSGSSSTLNIIDDTELKVVNTRKTVIPTGVAVAIKLLGILGALLLTGYLYFLHRMRKDKQLLKNTK